MTTSVLVRASMNDLCALFFENVAKYQKMHIKIP